MKILELRNEYHERICKEIIRVTESTKVPEYPNFADGSNKSSREIAGGIVKQLGHKPDKTHIKEQTVGELFELATREFLAKSFALLSHIRPGKWIYLTEDTEISNFDQFEHLAYLQKVIANDKSLAPALGGDYIVKPDIVVARFPLTDREINRDADIIGTVEKVSELTPLRVKNSRKSTRILHASISCKWTIRSDRSQNTRTEALNLIRNRKGHLPHIVAVTAEPLPTRIAALALGTGDLDCVYHFALKEMKKALKDVGNEDQLDIFNTMVNGRRLRDISDLPFDLAV